MIPYSYNMVDMGGIDLAEANETVVPGVYEKIVEAMNLCGDLILYNWKFAGINIAPSACTVLQQSDSILINGMIQVTELDKITVLGIAPPPSAVIPLLATQNGTYVPEPPADGFSPVEVSVSTVPVLTESEFDYLSKSQIQAIDNFGVVDSQGFECGTLYDGGEYHGLLQGQASGKNSATLLVNTSGFRNIFIIAINNEAKSYDLNISLTINGVAKETNLLEYNSYSGSGSNRRNYRVVYAQEELQVGDTIECAVSNSNNYTACAIAVLRDFGTSISKSMSTPDRATTGSYELASMALYGTARGDSSNGISLYSDYFEADAIVTTPDPGNNYKTSFIFWVE